MKNRFCSILFQSLLLWGGAIFSLVNPLFGQKLSSSSSLYSVIGLEYQRIENSTTHSNRPLILTIVPYSPADKAGLKVGDIIESINGKSTTSLKDGEINSIFQATTSSKNGITLEVSNFGYNSISRTLYPQMLYRNQISEESLVDAFAFYSLEDASARKIIYPFTTTGDSDTSYENLHYFSFTPSASQASTSDNASIVKMLASEFQKKGLVSDDSKAQIYIDYYYTIAHNPHYKEGVKASDAQKSSFRYNFATHSLQRFPLLNVGGSRDIAPFILTFGITIFDATQANLVIWNSEAVEFLTDEIPIVDYVQMAIPAMLMQFPLVRYNSNMQLKAVDKNFYYTGVIFDTGDMSRISQVLKDSPAEKAGLRSGDFIIAINGKSMNNATELTKAYQDFVKESIYYRDETTMFTDYKGIRGCRYWDKEDYDKVRKLFNKKKFKTVFSYLFAFRPYISSESESFGKIYFDINRGGVPQTIVVSPELRYASFISLD